MRRRFLRLAASCSREVPDASSKYDKSTPRARGDSSRATNPAFGDASMGDKIYERRRDLYEAFKKERESRSRIGEEGTRTDGEYAPCKIWMTSFTLATSLHVFPLLSRRVSSMPAWSSNTATISARPREAARCRGVVPEAGGCTPLGDMAL
jgi:hypothetical protein